MRAVLVLLVLGLVGFGLYRLLPASDVEGKGPEEPAIPFIERPQEDPGPFGRGGQPAADRPAKQAEAPRTEPSKSAGAFGLKAGDASSGATQDVGLAQALFFGGLADVQRAVARLEPSDAERRLFLSFANAVTGNQRAAIEAATGLDEAGALPAADQALLKAALTGRQVVAATPASTASEPLARRAMRLRLRALEAERALADGQPALAAVAYSDVLKAALTGPWDGDRRALLAWTEGLNAAQARHRWSPRGEWASVEMVVEQGDSLTSIRKRYLAEHPDGLICTGLIARANQLTGYIHPGDTLRVPTEHAWAFVDLSSRWLLYLIGDEVASAWEVGIGREGQETILGEFRAAEKQEEPTWFREGEQPAYFPDNPLGTRWIAWFRDGQKTSYGFHGTWEPESIGSASSDGCVRLRNEEVEVLFEILPVGARILVQQ